MTMVRQVLAKRTTKIGLGILFIFAVLAVFGGLIAPDSPLAQDPIHILTGPSSAHLLGTDYLGRDNLSRILAGTRATLLGALEVVGIALVLGTWPGVLSAFAGRRVEFVLMRIVDSVMTIPFIVLAIAVAGVFGSGEQQALIAIGVAFSPRFFRICRAATLSLAKSQYVEMAELLGATRRQIIWTHIRPKIVPTLAVTTAYSIAGGLLAVSALAILGLGIQPPAPTWGGMLSADLGYLTASAWQPVAPGIAIMLVVGALNLVADGIRDAAHLGRRGHLDNTSNPIAHELENEEADAA
jgi:peptide/nickel transport system permease protein